MWVYMKGVKNINLVQIIEFLYNGEVLIEQEGIKEFLDAAKDLQMKGLEDESVVAFGVNLIANFHPDTSVTKILDHFLQ